MREIVGRTFEMVKDLDASLRIEDVAVSQCVFDNCYFSKPSADGKRSSVQNTTADQCKFIGCQIGPGLFTDCHIKESTATDLVIFWGSIFRNVTFSGRIPAIKINTKITLIPDGGMQAIYDNSRAEHYKKIEMAIDISNARFTAFEAAGIPAALFKLDGDTQAIVRRENLAMVSNTADLDTNAWYPWIASFAASNERDLVLATPLSKPKSARDKFLTGIAELRDRGIADPA